MAMQIHFLYSLFANMEYEICQRSDNFKRTFWYPRILPKTNKQIHFSTVRQKNPNSIVYFLEESEDTKTHFEII